MVKQQYGEIRIELNKNLLSKSTWIWFSGLIEFFFFLNIFKKCGPRLHPQPLQLDFVYKLNCTNVKTLVLLSLSFKGLSTIYKTTFLYWLSVQQTVMGATCTLSYHPEDDHHGVHHHPAVANGDHPYQAQLQEVQGQCGQGEFKSSKSNLILDMQSLSCWCTVSVKEKPSTYFYKMRVLWFQLLLYWANSRGVEVRVLAGSQSSDIWSSVMMCLKKKKKKNLR